MICYFCMYWEGIRIIIIIIIIINKKGDSSLKKKICLFQDKKFIEH